MNKVEIVSVEEITNNIDYSNCVIYVTTIKDIKMQISIANDIFILPKGSVLKIYDYENDYKDSKIKAHAIVEKSPEHKYKGVRATVVLEENIFKDLIVKE